jgi:HSP20 family molecular chaperone IbpA
VSGSGTQSYTLKVWDSQGSESSQTIVVPFEAPTTYKVTFNVNVTGATVTLNGTTNPAGNYIFTGIAPGTYSYTVSKTGYNDATGSVTVSSQDVTESVTLTAPTYKVTFSVNVTGATVTLNGTTNSAGNYIFTGIAPGTYSYTISKTGYNDATGSVTVSSQDVTESVVLDAGTSIENIQSSNISVWSADGNIIVKSKAFSTITVIELSSGIVLKKIETPDEETIIAMPRGIYIVIIDNKDGKKVVKKVRV